MMKIEEYDDDSLYNTCIYNGRFYIKNLENPKEEPILIQPTKEKEIFITEEVLNLLKKSKNNTIKFKDLNDDDKLFEMVINFMVTLISNNKLKTPLIAGTS